MSNTTDKNFIQILWRRLNNALPLIFLADFVTTAAGSFGDSQATKSVSTFQ